MQDYEKLNQSAWDEEVRRNNYWTRPAGGESISLARSGQLRLTLTPDGFMPESWTKRIGTDVLALAAGGGQQGPVLAASGRNVTICDISQAQLEQDRKTAATFGLELRTVNTSMNDLSMLEDESFDTCINPVSLNFVDSLSPVFSEVRRILRPGGTFMFGIANPVMYIFDVKALERGKMKIRYTLPFSSCTSLSDREKRKMAEAKDTFEFSHTLGSVFSSLFSAGFVIEDAYTSPSTFEPVDSFIQDCYLAFLCVRS